MRWTLLEVDGDAYARYLCAPTRRGPLIPGVHAAGCLD